VTAAPGQPPPLLLLERHERVALLRLNRPEKRNALSLDMRAQLLEVLGSLSVDEEVRALVVTGAGSAFCSGMDVTEFGGDHAHRERIVELSVAMFGAFARFPKPVIAAVNGPAVAGGFAIALLCDLRIASEAARLGFSEPPGVPPSYAAARAALPAALARELTLTGRIVHAGEAADLGMVSEVVTPEALLPRALELAQQVAAAPAAPITKERILLERAHLYGPLFDEEERRLREALLGGDQVGRSPRQ
jgi:enoyl-CoA hydratase/carnithine racemase